jgi:meso-butanediol dehydrogenase/(S,S)-butanediol dehydrogenase/diacetyl reductase
MYDLGGKVALVTGTSSRKGIGCGIALKLAQEGADVVVTDKYIADKDIPVWDREAGWFGLESLVKEIEAMSRRALAVTADVSNSEQVNVMVEQALKKFGKIDILVNNAAISFGVSGSVPIMEMGEDAWNRSIAVNTTGVFLVCKAVVKNMIERCTGKIINISSISGKVGFAKKTAYVTSKFGVNGFTQALALELAPYHINVNAICPSGIASWGGRGGREMYQTIKQGFSEEEAASRVYNSDCSIPIGRTGKPEDVANIVAFLASSEADYITGQAINVNGGRMVAH